MTHILLTGNVVEHPQDKSVLDVTDFLAAIKFFPFQPLFILFLKLIRKKTACYITKKLKSTKSFTFLLSKC